MLLWIVEKVNGKLLKGVVDVEVFVVSIDICILEDGVVYLVLKGLNFNGYDFILMVEKVGVSVVIVSEDVVILLFVIMVEDIKEVFGLLGVVVKVYVVFKMIVIIGSSGKIIVKEMCVVILEWRGNVLVINGNFNNDIGVLLIFLCFEF